MYHKVPEARNGVPIEFNDRINDKLMSENRSKPDSKLNETLANLEDELELRKMLEEEEKLLVELRFKMLVERSLVLYENEELFEFFNLLKRDVISKR